MPNAPSTQADAQPTRAARSLSRRIVDAGSSIWTGITLLVLIILYSALGSAIPPLRQEFELTEFAYFSHWIFGALILLFCLVLIAATVRRIRFNLVNAGVLTVHTGLLLLAGGSLLYFGRKVEGDVMLDPPTVLVISKARLNRQDGGSAVLPPPLVAAKGKVWEQNMPMAGGAYRIEVLDIRHSGMNTGAQVTLGVTDGKTGPARTFTLSTDESASADRADVNQHIMLVLRPPTIRSEFYDAQTMALYCAAAGRESSFPLPDLPKYHERILPGGDPVLDRDGKKVAGDRTRPIPLLDAWDLPIALPPAGSAEAQDWPFTVTIDGFLPYAELIEEPAPGGPTLKPIARFTVESGGRSRTATLAGTNAQFGRDSAPGAPTVEFRWLDKPDLPSEWMDSVQGAQVLSVEVRDRGVRRQYDVQVGREIAVEGTDYRLKIDQIQPDWPLMTPGFEGARSPVIQVSVTAPTKKYQRTVIERFPQLSQDIDEKGVRHREGPYDPNLVLRYRDCSVDQFFVAAAADMTPVVVHFARGGKREVQKIEPGQTVTAGGGVSLTLRELITHPRMVGRPVVIPMDYRQRTAERSKSLIRVKVQSKSTDWHEHAWVPFSQYTYPGHRTPETVQVPGYGPIELVFSRRILPLGGALSLEQLVITWNAGRMSPRAWSSHIRIKNAAGRIHTAQVFTNHTEDIGPWTLFQSGAPTDHTQGWTILGVGNRIGIWPMTLGCIFISLGMLYAFYVKPWIKQRRKERFAMLAATKNIGPAAQPASAGRLLSFVPGALIWLMLASPAAWAQSGRTPQMPDDDIHRGIAQPHAPADAADAAGNAVKPAGEPLDPAALADMRRKRGEDAAASLRAMLPRLDLKDFRLLAVQHEGHYQTVEAWSRDVVKTVCGSRGLDGIDPVAEALEIALNPGPYVDRNVIFIKDLPIRWDITSHPVQLAPDEVWRIRRTGMVSYRFLNDDAVMNVLREMAGKVTQKRAFDRAEMAFAFFLGARRQLIIVPDPTATTRDAPWFTLEDLAVNVHGPQGDETRPVPGIDRPTAAKLLQGYSELISGWQLRDPVAVNRSLALFSDNLPKLAKPGVYLSPQRRAREAFYSEWHGFTVVGFWLYLLALVFSVWAVVSRWRAMRGIAITIFLIAFALHGAGLALRWYIVGRIPVANMFEAVVGSAWLGGLLALGLEFGLVRAWQVIYLFPVIVSVVLNLRYAGTAWYRWWSPLAVIGAGGLIADMGRTFLVRRRRTDQPRIIPPGIFVLAASFLGFFSLILGYFAAGSEITTIQGILDDVLLRIHTVLIITSYALVTLAFGVANTYLVARAVQRGTAAARVTLGCEIGAGAAVLVLLMEKLSFIFGPQVPTGLVPAIVAVLTAAGGLVGWSLPYVLRRSPRGAINDDPSKLVWDGMDLSVARRPDSSTLAGLDLSQMILMNMANVGLFVGMILGAVWADYSWGRPWGWDPKEVFALTTWLIYAILIHVRYVVRDKGLWSAVVAVIGFAMMMFNWWAVNFYIVGLHSYA